MQRESELVTGAAKLNHTRNVAYSISSQNFILDTKCQLLTVDRN